MSEITREQINVKLDYLVEKLDKIDLILSGNGDPSKGMVVRVDRLEQIEDSRRWNLRTIWGAIVAIIVGWAFKWTTGN